MAKSELRCRTFVGPGLWKGGPHLAVSQLYYEIGPKCTTGKLTGRCMSKNKLRVAQRTLCRTPETCGCWPLTETHQKWKESVNSCE